MKDAANEARKTTGYIIRSISKQMQLITLEVGLLIIVIFYVSDK